MRGAPSPAAERRQAEGTIKLGVEGKARLLFAVTVIGGSLVAAGWLYARSRDYADFALVTRDAVSGLIPESPVEYHGVEVGEVAKVELVDGGTVRVVMRIRREAPVTRATMARITSRGVATRGFTGYVYVSLEDASRDFRPLRAASGERYPVIPTLPARLDTLDTVMHDLQHDVGTLTALVTAALDPNTIAALKASIVDLDRTTRSLDAVLDPKAVAALRQTGADLDRAARSLAATLDPQTVASLRSSVSNLARISKTLADNNDRLLALLASGEDDARRLRPLLETSRDTLQALQTQVLPEAQRALAGMNRLSASLEGFGAKIERDPSVLVRGAAPPRPGPGETP